MGEATTSTAECSLPGKSLSVMVLAPYPHDRAPGQRYRIEQWMPRLEEMGVSCRLVPFEDEELYDLMERSGRWPQKAGIGPALLEPLVARRRPLVLDFDDAIWLASKNVVNPLAPLLKFQSKTRTIARHAHAVIAGNDYLADWARAYNQSVFVVPSTIEMQGSYAHAKQHEHRGPLVIGWSGSFSTLTYLEQLRPVLTELGRRRPFRLRVICNGPRPSWPGIDLEWIRWSSANEVPDLLGIDIGLMPQPDEQWTRGKCGMKALQYMALGIPPVASRNGVLPRIIDDGVNGYLSAEHGEWLARLEALAGDVLLRERMGAAARRTVVEQFSASVQAPRVAEILASVAGRQFQGGARSPAPQALSAPPARAR